MSNSNSQKIVSVIIAAFNVERYIAHTLDSVLAQSYKHIEVIVVNDGSTDDTEKIIKEYAKNDFRIVVLSQPNKGVSAARNAGLEIAKGEYLCFFDADDLMLPTKIESQITYLEQHPAADFVYSKVYYFMDGTRDVYRHDLVIIRGAPVYKKLLQHGNFIYTGTVFFKRDVFDRYGGFDESLRSAEEFDYWLRLAQNGVAIMHQDVYLTLCRSRGNGLTSDSVTMYKTALLVLDKHLTSKASKLTSYQYLKFILLYTFTLLKKPQTNNKRNAGGNQLKSENLAGTLFSLLKKIKFSLTFKKIHDTNLYEFLTHYESTH